MSQLKGAYTAPRSPSNYTPLTVKAPGLIDATFIGWTEPLVKYNTFETCPVCEKNPAKMPACAECDGTGSPKRTVICARYLTDDGEQREEMTYKLSKGGTGKSGRLFSPSTMYLRAWTLTGIDNPAHLADYDWTGVKIPCQLLIKQSQTGKLKIADVVAKRGPQIMPSAPPMEKDEDVPF